MAPVPPSVGGPAPSGEGSNISRRPGGWLRGLAPFILLHARKAWLAVLATLIGQGASVFIPLIQKVVIDDVILAGTKPLLPWLALMVVAAVIVAVATTVRRKNGNSFGFAVQHELRSAVFQHVQKLDIGYGARLPGGDLLSTGEVVSRTTADITLIQTLFSQVHVLLGSLFMVVASVVMMIVLSPILGLVVLSLLPALWWSASRLRRDLFPAVWSDQQSLARLAGLIDETTSGARVVRAFGQQERETSRFIGAAEKLFGSRMRTATINARFTPLLQVLPSFGQLLVLVIGAWLAWTGTITAGTFLAFFSYLVQIAGPVRTLAGALTTIEQARTGAERVLDLLSARPSVAEDPAAIPLEITRGAVTFNNVTVRHVDKAVLSDVSFDLAPGETVAIVGAAGSGKSTLALLLARLHDPIAGAVLIDGQDIAKVTLSSLLGAVSVVFEDPFLYAGTVAENIAKARPFATRGEIEAAARIAGADEFITGLPQGYDTPIAELGATLSGGQRQRLTIARAALTTSSILVLDDATSAVDARTESAILASLRSARSGRTTLVVARRRSTIALADRIAVLDDGCLSDIGTHAELLERSERYRQLLSFDLVEDTDEQAHGNDASADPRAWPDGDEIADVAHLPAFTETISTAGHARQVRPSQAALALAGDDIKDRLLSLPAADQRPSVDGTREAENRAPFTVRGFLGGHRQALLLGLLLVGADTLLGLASPSLIGEGVDAVASRSTPELATVAILYLGLLLATWLVARLVALQTSRTAEQLLFSLRVRVFAKLQRLPIERYEQESAGRLMARATTDIDVLAGLLQQGLLVAVVGLATCLGIAIVLAAQQPLLAASAAIVLPALVFATEWYRRASRNAYEGSRRRVAAVYAGIQEGVSAARVTRTLGGETRVSDRFRSDSAHYRDARVKAATISAYYFPFLQFLSTIAKVCVLATGAVLVGESALSIGLLVTFLLYLDQFFAPVQQLSQVFDQWFQAGTSFRRIRELLEEPDGALLPDNAARLPRPQGELRFRAVSFRYDGRTDLALDTIDLAIPAGQHIAVVGRTGAGKSTLARLAARFSDPLSGKVLLDGLALDQIEAADLRRAISVVPQEPLLFARSIAENIAYGRPEAEPAEIEAAARLAGAHHFILSLPRGYRTVVAERGRSLSAGQRQLICLARALLVDPRILILDEATAQVDQTAEDAVRRAIDAGKGRRTTIVIAHRLETALAAERVIVLDQGHIVEDGDPRTLIQSHGPFRTLNDAAFASNDAVSTLNDLIERRLA